MRCFSVVFALLILAGAATVPSTASAGEVRVAVAANFTAAMQEIAADFEKHSGQRVVLSFGSTGALYAQIRHGAPYDLFLAADERRPLALEREGTTVAGSRFTYAVGRLVLWSPRAGVVDGQGRVLQRGGFAHLAIANPKTAPYGAAARQVLQHMHLWRALLPRLVRGENIAQTHEFVASGNADLGFVALSEVALTHGGSRWIVPQRLYAPIRQQAVLLARGRANPAARALVVYLKSAAGRAVITHFGYAAD